MNYSNCQAEITRNVENSKLKVVLFSDSDVFAGTESHIFTLASGLNQEGWDPIIACPNPSPLAERARSKRIQVLAIDKSGLVDIPAIRKLAALLQTEQVQVIHCHNGRTHLNNPIPAALARRVRTDA